MRLIVGEYQQYNPITIKISSDPKAKVDFGFGVTRKNYHGKRRKWNKNLHSYFLKSRIPAFRKLALLFTDYRRNERIRVKDAHLAFDDLLQDLMPGNEVAKLFRLVLEDQYQSNEQSKYQQLKRIEREIKVLEKRQNKLLEKLLDQVITDDVYKTHDSNLRGQLTEKQQQIADLNDHQKDLNDYIEFGVFLLGNLKTLYDSVDVSIQHKLLGSILDEKLEFQNRKYRTPKFKEGFSYIYRNINKLENSSIKKGGSLSKAFLVVGYMIELSNLDLVRGLVYYAFNFNFYYTRNFIRCCFG